MDYKEIKKEFPLLQTNMNGKEIVFLDSAASSQKPQKVIDVFNDYYRCRNANIHRGAYRLSYEATDLYEKTRDKVAQFIGSDSPNSIIFTRNTTEGINLVAYAWGEENINEGDEIIVSEIEHHSNLIPWFMLAKKKKAIIKHLPLNDDTSYDLNALPQLLNKRTKIVALQTMSNALGTIQKVEEISKLIRKNSKAIFVLDGAQLVCHKKIDVAKIDCDFFAFSAHKMLGPTGVGVLYGKENLLEKMTPFLGGGEMILRVNKDGFEEARIPQKFEAGTPNIAGVVAFHTAIDYLSKIGMEQIQEHEANVLDYLYEESQKIEGIKIYGLGLKKKYARGAIFSFNLLGVHSHDVASVLDEDGIAIRAGHHCCEPLMQKLSLPGGTARASFYIYNGAEDVDKLMKSLQRVRSIFKYKKEQK